MCGIAGAVNCADAQTVDVMCGLIRHRGPDDRGAYADDQARLGMVRLSIIDRAGGRQPMTDEQGRFQLVFNGEIYNYQSLREELVLAGHRLKSAADTEVVVHLYEDLQQHCVERLQGDFSFAVWDRQEKRLFLARDRFGVKPLYYWHSGGRFAFASELKALLSLPEVSRDIDDESLDDYLTFLYIPSPRTIFRSIRKLPAGCWLTFAQETVKVERYWKPSAFFAAKRPSSAAELKEAVLERLKQAVRCRLMSEVPLGAFLSGGVDSSAVVACMSLYSASPVETFSLGFQAPDDSYNELPAARLIAQAFGTHHHEFLVKPEISRLLPQVVWHMDEPFADSSALLNFLISREAKRTVTVALTGIGGDELFGGYPRYLGAWASTYAEPLPLWLRRSLAPIARLLPESKTAHNLSGRIKRFAKGLGQPSDRRYLSWTTHLGPDEKAGLYSDSFKMRLNRYEATAAASETFNRLPGGYLDRIGFFDLETYLPDDLLAMGDKMSMAHGLEVRVPFCDHRLAELVASVPLQERMHGFHLKGLLKSALKGMIPEKLLKKPKQGFMLPLAAWLKGPLSSLCDDLLDASRIRRRGFFEPQAVGRIVQRLRAGENPLSHRLYALMVFELWCQRYLDHGRA